MACLFDILQKGYRNYHFSKQPIIYVERFFWVVKFRSGLEKDSLFTFFGQCFNILVLFIMQKRQSFPKTALELHYLSYACWELKPLKEPSIFSDF